MSNLYGSTTLESDVSLMKKKSKLVSSPNPTWKPGDKQPHPYDINTPHIAFNPKELISSYPLLISGVVPRPIAFVSTKSASGIGNLSPFSYFSAVAHDPPTVSVGICKNRDGSDKDTYNNIKETGQFVVNIISDWFVEAANHTCGAFPPEIDEMEVSGLTPLDSLLVSPPRVAEAAFQMECQLTSVTEVKNDQGITTSNVVFGRVIMFHVLEPLVQKGPRGIEVKIDGYQPIARLGGDTFVTLGDYFDIPRPKA